MTSALLRLATAAAILTASLAPAAAAQDAVPEASTPGSEPTLRRVRLYAPRPAALHAQLAAEGFDVMHGPVSPTALDVVVTVDQFAALERRGLQPELMEIGRPLRDILAEKGQLAGPFEPNGAGQPDDAGGADGSVPSGYATRAGIEAQMAALAATRPDICELVDLTTTFGPGPTHAGNHLFALKISGDVGVAQDEPAMLIVSAYHCREVVTPVLALDAAARLLAGHGSDATLTDLVDAHEIWIAPLWNPDGYDYVFSTDNLWRKNRRPTVTDVGVDINRNHSFGWASICGGSTLESSLTYKGPSPSSEVEVQTMEALSADRRFAKVLDYHSSGREVLWGYDCSTHPLASFLQAEAVALSIASGYGGDERPPSAEGEHYEWQLAEYGSLAMLTETQLIFQPDFVFAESEAVLVWPGVQWMLERPVSITGRVTDACTNLPLEAAVAVQGITYSHGESLDSGGAFGRFNLFLPAGNYLVDVSAPGYAPQTLPATVTASGSTDLDVALDPLVPAGCWTDLGFALPGGSGPPSLQGVGTLAGGDPVSVTLAAARANAPAFLIVGYQRIDFFPFYGGTLVPDVDVPGLIVVLVTDGDGGVELPTTMPVGIPPGFELYLQTWVDDPGAPFGFAASNALEAVTP